MTELRPNWAARYPERWDRELRELDATGWEWSVVPRDETVVLRIDWPLGPGVADSASRGAPGSTEAVTVGLDVWFPEEYPFFPPYVQERGNRLELRRHRNAHGGLCLVEENDWQPDTTVADLLTRQLPRLIATGRNHRPPRPGVEMPVPEPVEVRMHRVAGQQPVIMPTTPIPEGADEGALVIRYTVRPGGVIGAGLVERILGDQLDIPGPAPTLEPLFHLVTFGRWAHDPDFDPDDAPEQTWERLQRRLQPLRVVARPGDRQSGDVEMPPEQMETLCLLVPSEHGYRQPGKDWVAILRVGQEDGSGSYHQIPVRRLGPDSYAPRTPESELLRSRHVVVVGIGAIGSHIAVDLAQTGVGRLDLVDGDEVDVGTASRQYAPLYAAGRTKVHALLGHLRVLRPDTELGGLEVHIGQATNIAEGRRKRAKLDRVLRTADLVIDATAAPAVTRYLGAVRHALGLPFLHASATAGAWGGCVFLATAETGCWACLQHHRRDKSVPFPTADPAGAVLLVGCADSTFTGTIADLATVAHHASRVAIEHLTGGGGLGGELFVAHLRDPDGVPQPVVWQHVSVPVHPQCRVHATPENGLSGAATAADPRPRTMTEQPQEREVDGHSPPRAPIPVTQQRNTTGDRARARSRRRRTAVRDAGDTSRPRRR